MVDLNKIYSTKNYGDFKIIEDLGPSAIDHKRRVKIKFLFTGTEKIIRLDEIDHDIRDHYYPKIYGVACRGNVSGVKTIYKSAYDTWINMLSRCYNPNDKDYINYGAVGVRVSDDWLCFENYLNDIKYLPNYNLKCQHPNMYQLDKDYLQSDVLPNNRIYSKETCMYISRRDNVNMRTLDNASNKVNKYRGVYKNGARYQSTIIINGTKINIGSFDDEIAAANAYNYYRRYMLGEYDMIQVQNNVPYMSGEEFFSHNKRPKVMCEIV